MEILRFALLTRLYRLEACVFYIYTKKIKFLPLKSEDAAMRSALLLSSPDTEPPPCSAKSMYRLAEAVSASYAGYAYDATHRPFYHD